MRPPLDKLEADGPWAVKRATRLLKRAWKDYERDADDWDDLARGYGEPQPRCAGS